MASASFECSWGWAGGGRGKLLASREAGAGEAGKGQRRGLKGYSNFEGGMTIMRLSQSASRKGYK